MYTLGTVMRLSDWEILCWGTYTGVVCSSFSGILSISSITPLLMVDPLQRVLFIGTGDSQFAQSVSSMESKPRGVQEKCLLFVGRDFSREASLRLLIGVGDAVADGESTVPVLCVVCPALDDGPAWLMDPVR